MQKDEKRAEKLCRITPSTQKEKNDKFFQKTY
jgi:hypothetical protein